LQDLDKEQTGVLEKSLSSFLQEGQTLTMSVKTDASILGGLVVEIGDKHVDLSIMSRITKLQNELKAAI
jgi:F-type H+-transporting ATPase subunit O